MRYTHFPTPWDERCSSRAGTLLYGFNQQLTNPLSSIGFASFSIYPK